MQAIILVHGIMGSKLKLGTEEIWPPSLREMLSKPPHYLRIDKLRNPKAVATEIIYQYTSLKPIYAPIIRVLDDIVDEQGGLRPKFCFDWRVDLADAADLLAQTISDVCSGPNAADTVTLVAHSMGGLVTRQLLESGKFSKKKWFKKIDRFVAICVPHVGAPIAVARALGLSGSTGIWPADMKSIMNDKNFAAGFELFPAAPTYRKSTLFNTQGVPWDIYAGNTAAKFGLSVANQNAALHLWDSLKARPSGVEYISIAGTGLSTENAYYFADTNYQFGTSTDGDGTVPLWSAAHGAVDQLYTLPGEHIDIMNTGAFDRLIRNIFASSRSTRRPIMDHPVVSISVAKKDIDQNELMEVLLIPDSRTTNMTGRLVFEEISAGADDQSVTFSPTGSDVSITYQGPPISSLKVEVPAPQAAGLYRISFEGTHRTSEDTKAVIFVGPFSEKQIVKSEGKQRRKKAAKRTVAKKSKK